MNRHIKTQMRAIVVTDKYLYRLDEKFKTKKAPINIHDIVAAKINDESDNQLIVLTFKNSENDLVFYLDSRNKQVDRVPEFLANIYRIQIKSVARIDLIVLIKIFTNILILVSPADWTCMSPRMYGVESRPKKSRLWCARTHTMSNLKRTAK